VGSRLVLFGRALGRWLDLMIKRGSIILRILNKRGEILTEETGKWILYLAILAAVGYALGRVILGSAG
jgi:hypothetical protein